MGRTLVQLFIDGISIGIVYVLMASGFNLIMSVEKILFLPFAQFYMLGAYFAWYLMVPLKLNFAIALVVATIGTGILGAIAYAMTFRWVQYKEGQFLTNLLIGVGWMLIITQVALKLFGTEARGIPTVFKGHHLDSRAQHICRKGRGDCRRSGDPRGHALLSAEDPSRPGDARSLVQLRRGGPARGQFNQSLHSHHGFRLRAGRVGRRLAGTRLRGHDRSGQLRLPSASGGPSRRPGEHVGERFLSGLLFGMALSYGQYFIGGGQAQIAFFVIVAIVLMLRPGGFLGKAMGDIPL